MQAVNIKIEGLKEALGIGEKQPRITWQCEGGKKQSAYEIRATSRGEVFWESGKVESSRMNAVVERPAESRRRVALQIRLWDEEGNEGGWSGETFYETGLLLPSDFCASFILPEEEKDPQEHRPASYLRTGFEVETPGNARLYVTAHGLYEVFLNGSRVGDFVLAPGSYDYDRHLAYQTYDVTSLIRQGGNTVRVILGDGWYRSVSGVDGDRNLYGTDLGLFFQLEVDGRAVCVSSADWEASQSGPIREDDMQQGEVVDASMEEIGQWHGVKEGAFDVSTLFCSNAVPVREHERFAGKIIKTPDGRTVIDYGQNLAGYIEFRLNAREGDEITLWHGETLDENGNFTQENFQDRKRHKEGGTKQRVVYRCKEGENRYKSKFTIWGFRYALVETSIDLSDAEFTAIAVYSDMEETAEFTCSEPALEQLFSNCMWSMKSNFCDVPTDCPTRERAAWTGDMGVFVHTGLYLMDSETVIRKWLAECRLAQYEDGRIANIAPRNNRPSFFSGLLAGSVGWGDACILVPYEIWRRTGDVRILEENYDMMRRWYGYLIGRAKKSKKSFKSLFDRNPYKCYTIDSGIDYGEWCEPDVVSTSAMRTPQEKVATAYFAYSGRLLSEIALILGKVEDAEKYRAFAANARLAFRRIALTDGEIRSDRQADYIRAITFGLLEKDEEERAAAALNDLVVKCGFRLNTGFLSTPDLCRVLTDYGYTDTAYRVLLGREMPGWLYEVERGATTIWENWDGIDPQGKPSASLNHYSKGAIAGWLIDGVCGIRISGGEITLEPHPHESLSSARATYRSPYGRIVSGWEYENGALTYTFELPANTQAKVLLPDGRSETIGAGRCVLH